MVRTSQHCIEKGSIVGSFSHQLWDSVLFCDVVCIQRNRDSCCLYLQCWGYCAGFLSSACKDTMNILKNCSFFSPISICLGQLIKI